MTTTEWKTLLDTAPEWAQVGGKNGWLRPQQLDASHPLVTTWMCTFCRKPFVAGEVGLALPGVLFDSMEGWAAAHRDCLVRQLAPPLEELERRFLAASGPALHTSLDRPDGPRGRWFLDVWLEGAGERVVVEWMHGKPFSVDYKGKTTTFTSLDTLELQILYWLHGGT